MNWIFSIAVFFLIVSPEHRENDSVQLEGGNGVVLQLFTSQGCSSCPKADRLLARVKEDYSSENVSILSYHVDYWDRLGWKDPFSKREFSELQYTYATKFKSRNVYTPQLILNGKTHVVGSNEEKVLGNLKKYLRSTSENKILVSNAKRNNNLFEFDYQIEGSISERNLIANLVIEEFSTSIKSGENRNKTLTNSNIVIEQIEYSLDSHEGETRLLIPEKYQKLDNLSVVLFIQKEDLEIVGTSKIKL